MSDESPGSTPDPKRSSDAKTRWTSERTTFQRVYDVMTGVSDYATAADVAERARCSADGARNALAQLVEMGIVERRDGRPAEYRRNDSYFRWKRIEELAREHSATALRSQVADLLEEDEEFRDRFDATDPDSIPPATFEITDHDAIHDRFAALSRWRSVRHDIDVLQRAAHRAEQRNGNDVGDTASA
ncbi:hypothetical protein SAMN05192561_1385 [Halopenitus malekzadehii]|uniref:Sugar-specific transcriptional regulator TrmB n=1 Tax=Halopenitus malekzadehii TaxID=1267564 RepID=A0A1H6K1P4_9EURY|nr:hypothetical protein [Halopenitus malekzadehii]SEH68871.1 hypothetical protein SAMN05192561_1385 [Halopenitus malekzadehii]